MQKMSVSKGVNSMVPQEQKEGRLRPQEGGQSELFKYANNRVNIY